MKNIYLFLAVLGGVIPYIFFFQYFQVEGLNLPLFFESLFVNDATTGFSVDLLITSIVFWLFMFVESKQLNAPKPYLFIVLNLTIGLSCALPAYLYAKARIKGV